MPAADRDFLLRLTPDRALETLEEAEEFLRDRGLLTLTPTCSLPSLFGACHEEPYSEHGRGFGGWPKTKWWWGDALAQRPGVLYLRILRGKGVFLSEETAALADPLCRAELARADEGGFGDDPKRLVAHLLAAGPSLLPELREELAIEPRAMRRLRAELERFGAVVSRGVRIEASGGGHLHASELARWDQVHERPSPRGGLEDLLVAGVRAAVAAPEREVRSWFTWKAEPEQIERLVQAGRLERPGPGMLATS